MPCNTSSAVIHARSACAARSLQRRLLQNFLPCIRAADATSARCPAPPPPHRPTSRAAVAEYHSHTPRQPAHPPLRVSISGPLCGRQRGGSAVAGDRTGCKQGRVVRPRAARGRPPTLAGTRVRGRGRAPVASAWRRAEGAPGAPGLFCQAVARGLHVRVVRWRGAAATWKGARRADYRCGSKSAVVQAGGRKRRDLRGLVAGWRAVRASGARANHPPRGWRVADDRGGAGTPLRRAARHGGRARAAPAAVPRGVAAGAPARAHDEGARDAAEHGARGGAGAGRRDARAVRDGRAAGRVCGAREARRAAVRHGGGAVGGGALVSSGRF